MKLKDASSLEEKLDSILKSRDITLLTKVHLEKSYGFSSSHVWMRELDYKESWALKNQCFWTVVLKKTPKSPLDCKEFQPVHPKGSGLMLRLKLQYFGHLMRRTDSLEKTLVLGKIEGGKRREWQRMRQFVTSLTWWTRVWVSSASWWWTGKPGALQSTGSQSQTRLSNWTKLKVCMI